MNIVWLVVDCLRYDAFSSNGYHRPTTAAIDDRLESDFVKFDNAFTQSGFTLNVITSMMTGTYPTTHGVLRWTDEFLGDLPSYREIVRNSELAPAEAIAGMNFITEEWGLINAFDEVYNLDDKKSKRGCNQAVATELRTQAEAIFNEREKFNTLLWFFDLHTPWLSELQFDGTNPSRDHYDTELRYVAGELEKLFVSLEKEDKYDDTMIILTGDHGEIFDEYSRLPWNQYTSLAKKVPALRQLFVGDGHLGHLGRPFFEELVHVPLYVKLPRTNLGGETVNGQVELIDILPTIADVAEVDPPDTVEGESLLPRIEGNKHGKEYVRAEMGPNPVDGFTTMIRGEKFKYMRFDKPSVRDINNILNDLPRYLGRRFFTPTEVLVECGSEDENVIHFHQDIATIMKEQATQSIYDGEANADSEISEDKRKELENLGYL